MPQNELTNQVSGNRVSLMKKDLNVELGASIVYPSQNTNTLLASGKSIFLDYVHNQIFGQNTNLIVMVEGLPGKGKSVSSLGILERWSLRAQRSFSVEYNVVFSIQELMQRVADLEARTQRGENVRGTAILYDDAGVSMDSRGWMHTLHKLLNDSIEVFRYLGIVMFITAPNRTRLDKKLRELAHATLKPFKVRNGEYSLCKFYINEKHWKTGDDVPTLLRAKHYGWVLKMDMIKVRKPSATIMHDYDRLSRVFKGGIIQQSYQKLVRKNSVPESERKDLTPRQKDIYLLAKKGLSAGQIAIQLGIGEGGVETYLRAIKNRGYDDF